MGMQHAQYLFPADGDGLGISIEGYVLPRLDLHRFLGRDLQCEDVGRGRASNPCTSAASTALRTDTKTPTAREGPLQCSAAMGGHSDVMACKPLQRASDCLMAWKGGGLGKAKHLRPSPPLLAACGGAWWHCRW